MWNLERTNMNRKQFLKTGFLGLIAGMFIPKVIGNESKQNKEILVKYQIDHHITNNRLVDKFSIDIGKDYQAHLKKNMTCGHVARVIKKI